jgi:hypothetical protein
MEIALIVAVVILAGVGLFVMLKRARPSQAT